MTEDPNEPEQAGDQFFTLTPPLEGELQSAITAALGARHPARRAVRMLRRRRDTAAFQLLWVLAHQGAEIEAEWAGMPPSEIRPEAIRRMRHVAELLGDGYSAPFAEYQIFRLAEMAVQARIEEHYP